MKITWLCLNPGHRKKQDLFPFMALKKKHFLLQQFFSIVFFNASFYEISDTMKIWKEYFVQDSDNRPKDEGGASEPALYPACLVNLSYLPPSS